MQRPSSTMYPVPCISSSVGKCRQAQAALNAGSSLTCWYKKVTGRPCTVTSLRNSCVAYEYHCAPAVSCKVSQSHSWAVHQGTDVSFRTLASGAFTRLANTMAKRLTSARPRPRPNPKHRLGKYRNVAHAHVLHAAESGLVVVVFAHSQTIAPRVSARHAEAHGDCDHADDPSAVKATKLKDHD